MFTYMYLQTQKPHCISSDKCCISSYNQPFNPLFPNKGGVRSLICEVQAPVVPKLDSIIRWINHYPLDYPHWIDIYPADSIIHLLNITGPWMVVFSSRGITSRLWYHLKSTLGVEIKYSMTAFLMEVKLPWL